METLVTAIIWFIPALLIGFWMWSVERAYRAGYDDACAAWSKAQSQYTEK